MLRQLEIQAQAISEINLEHKKVQIAFSPEEVEKIEQIFEKIQLADDSPIFILKKNEYDKYLVALSKIKTGLDIKSTPAALMRAQEIAEAHVDGWK